MGRKLVHKPNVDNLDSTFPNGRIKDDTGLNNGTPFDEEVYGDLHQTEEAIQAEAEAYEADQGMTGLPDSAFNGFQFMNARRKVQPFAQLYLNGRFSEVGANFGGVDFIQDCFVLDNECYQVDQGSDQVIVYNIFDGTEQRIIGGGQLNGALGCQIVGDILGSGDEFLRVLYVISNGDSEIRAFNAKDGSRMASYDITVSPLNDPRYFQIDFDNDRIYVWDQNTGKVEVFVLSTDTHVPGESWTPASGVTDMFFVFSKDRCYIARGTTDVKVYQVDGTAVASEDLTGLTQVDKIHVVGRKLYVLKEGSNSIQPYTIRPAAIPNVLANELISNSLVGNCTNFFIRHGVMYICDTASNDVFPIKCVNVQEHI